MAGFKHNIIFGTSAVYGPQKRHLVFKTVIVKVKIHLNQGHFSSVHLPNLLAILTVIIKISDMSMISLYIVYYAISPTHRFVNLSQVSRNQFKYLLFLVLHS